MMIAVGWPNKKRAIFAPVMVIEGPYGYDLCIFNTKIIMDKSIDQKTFYPKEPSL